MRRMSNMGSQVLSIKGGGASGESSKILNSDNLSNASRQKNPGLPEFLNNRGFQRLPDLLSTQGELAEDAGSVSETEEGDTGSPNTAPSAMSPTSKRSERSSSKENRAEIKEEKVEGKKLSPRSAKESESATNDEDDAIQRQSYNSKPLFDVFTIRKWFNEMDTDGNNLIGRNEWLRWLRQNPKFIHFWIYGRFDGDPGVVTGKDRFSVESQKQLADQAKEIKRLMQIWRDLDKNGNGLLSWEQFLQVWRKSGHLLELQTEGNPRESMAEFLQELHENEGPMSDDALSEFERLSKVHLCAARKMSVMTKIIQKARSESPTSDKIRCFSDASTRATMSSTQKTRMSSSSTPGNSNLNSPAVSRRNSANDVTKRMSTIPSSQNSNTSSRRASHNDLKNRKQSMTPSTVPIAAMDHRASTAGMNMQSQKRLSLPPAVAQLQIPAPGEQAATSNPPGTAKQRASISGTPRNRLSVTDAELTANFNIPDGIGRRGSTIDAAADEIDLHISRRGSAVEEQQTRMQQPQMSQRGSLSERGSRHSLQPSQPDEVPGTLNANSLQAKLAKTAGMPQGHRLSVYDQFEETWVPSHRASGISAFLGEAEAFLENGASLEEQINERAAKTADDLQANLHGPLSDGLVFHRASIGASRVPGIMNQRLALHGEGMGSRRGSHRPSGVESFLQQQLDTNNSFSSRRGSAVGLESRRGSTRPAERRLSAESTSSKYHRPSTLDNRQGEYWDPSRPSLVVPDQADQSRNSVASMGAFINEAEAAYRGEPQGQAVIEKVDSAWVNKSRSNGHRPSSQGMGDDEAEDWNPLDNSRRGSAVSAAAPEDPQAMQLQQLYLTGGRKYQRLSVLDNYEGEHWAPSPADVRRESLQGQVVHEEEEEEIEAEQEEQHPAHSEQAMQAGVQAQSKPRTGSFNMVDSSCQTVLSNATHASILKSLEVDIGEGTAPPNVRNTASGQKVHRISVIDTTSGHTTNLSTSQPGHRLSRTTDQPGHHLSQQGHRLSTAGQQGHRLSTSGASKQTLPTTPVMQTGPRMSISLTDTNGNTVASSMYGNEQVQIGDSNPRTRDLQGTSVATAVGETSGDISSNVSSQNASATDILDERSQKGPRLSIVGPSGNILMSNAIKPERDDQSEGGLSESDDGGSLRASALAHRGSAKRLSIADIMDSSTKVVPPGVMFRRVSKEWDDQIAMGVTQLVEHPQEQLPANGGTSSKRPSITLNVPAAQKELPGREQGLRKRLYGRLSNSVGVDVNQLNPLTGLPTAR